MEEKPGFGMEGRPEEKWGNGTEERTELGAEAVTAGSCAGAVCGHTAKAGRREIYDKKNR